MRRILTLTYVLLTTVTPLLHQAEAAEGLARSLSELVAHGVIETTEAECDGLSISSTKVEPGPATDPHWLGDPAPNTFALAFAPLPALSRPDASDLSFQPLAPAQRCQAYLQVFLF
jgi:hypothetical protein